MMDGGALCEKMPEPGMELRRSSLTENLKSRKARLESELAGVNEAISALEANPQLQKLFDIVSRVR